ncbi:MAG: hypothetical protein OQJ95_00045 [Kangiella sp.]|jgi:hypothetical protein|nr:hypothetical protein [Kangiella sp.]MCW9027863.1 hypothetical protein [Kangiella sp.]
MKYLKRTALTFGLLPALMAAPVTNAASLDVDVDIDLPNVVILYGYTDIDLTMTADQFGPLVDASCTTDDCSVADNTTQSGVLNNGTVDLAFTNNAAGTNPTITLNNSWGVRSFGYTSLAPTITDNGSDAPVGNLAIEQITTPSPSLQTGSVSFDLDLSQISTDSVRASYTITVTGS